MVIFSHFMVRVVSVAVGKADLIFMRMLLSEKKVIQVTVECVSSIAAIATSLSFFVSFLDESSLVLFDNGGRE